MTLQKTDQAFLLVSVLDLKIQIGTVKTVDLNHRGPKTERLNDVLPDPDRRGSSIGTDHGMFREAVDEGFDLQIIRTKGMPPLRNAVSFIHRDKRDRIIIAKRAKRFGGEAFRCNVHDLIGMVSRPAKYRPLLSGRQAAVQECSPDAIFLKCKHLVQHQGNKRRNDQCQAIKCQGRDLKANRLTRACRHDTHRVFSGKDSIDQPFLSRTEAFITIGLFQDFPRVQFPLPLPAASNIQLIFPKNNSFIMKFVT